MVEYKGVVLGRSVWTGPHRNGEEAVGVTNSKELERLLRLGCAEGAVT